MERNLRKTRTGKVISDKMDKTIVVAIEEHVQHPLYKKICLKESKWGIMKVKVSKMSFCIICILWVKLFVLIFD